MDEIYGRAVYQWLQALRLNIGWQRWGMFTGFFPDSLTPQPIRHHFLSSGGPRIFRVAKPKNPTWLNHGITIAQVSWEDGTNIYKGYCPSTRRLSFLYFSLQGFRNRELVPPPSLSVVANTSLGTVNPLTDNLSFVLSAPASIYPSLETATI